MNSNTCYFTKEEDDFGFDRLGQLHYQRPVAAPFAANASAILAYPKNFAMYPNTHLALGSLSGVNLDGLGAGLNGYTGSFSGPSTSYNGFNGSFYGLTSSRPPPALRNSINGQANMPYPPYAHLQGSVGLGNYAVPSPPPTESPPPAESPKLAYTTQKGTGYRDYFSVAPAYELCEQLGQMTPTYQPMAKPQYQQRHSVNGRWYGYDASPAKGPSAAGQYLLKRLAELLPKPPLSQAPTRPDFTHLGHYKKNKRRLKFLKSQDDLIVKLKNEGRPWVEIAELAGVSSFLAARNRYQVIVGQQGNNNSLSWTSDDRVRLQRILDVGELEKWRFIAQELSKITRKLYLAKECWEFVQKMLYLNPYLLGITDDAITELEKEKTFTRKIMLQLGLAHYQG